MKSDPDGWYSGVVHWYNCPNGHVFALGECGLLLEEASCYECGARLGMMNHLTEGGITLATNMED